MPDLPTSSPAPTRVPRAAWAFALAWVAGFGVLQWSVVQYRVPIVTTLTACCAALVVWQWRRAAVLLAPLPVALMLLGAALVTLRVPLFSYLTPTGLLVAKVSLVSACVVAGLLLEQGRARPALVALGTALAGYLVAGVAAIRSDPSPRIDVWVTLQQASDWLARGVSFYEVTWVGSPGMKDNFTYLPWTTVLLAPGRWLAGDVRWALLAWTLVAVVGVWLLATGTAVGGRSTGDRWPASRTWRGAAAIALLLLAPGTLTQLDQAWTEPLLLAGLVWWAVLVDRDRAWWAVVPLALACASKQHLALLLPILLVWRPFGVRRTLATGALTGLLVLPWVVAGPRDFFQDTVGVLVTFPPIRFANTLYLFAQHTLGVTLPFWVTGLVVLGSLAAIVWVVRRRQPGTGELLRWLALMLLVANLMNKQAFYNQYWLVGGLLVASLALAPVRPAAAVDRLAPDIPASTREREPCPTSESPAPSAGGAAPSAAT
ncbi:MAG TPA: glycosyltransferase 87 family protein [Candidatus Nanopelagicales bacterium]